jgi:hypothetical protein
MTSVTEWLFVGLKEVIKLLVKCSRYFRPLTAAPVSFKLPMVHVE